MWGGKRGMFVYCKIQELTLLENMERVLVARHG
jgi:hypothetical protein